MNIYSKLTFLLLFLFLQLGVHGQTCLLSGKIKDSTGNALEMATIALLKLPDSTQAAVQTSDEHGAYRFANVQQGEYLLLGFLLGYKNTLSEKIIVDGVNFKQVDLVLENDSGKAEEVIISAERPLVRQESDKMVVDVANSLSNSGLNALDVLAKSPGVSVDKDGKIDIRGKKGVLVMIDDKPIYTDPANLLKTIPSDQIKEIEIITSPSAKYDAAGSSGIINIRLKKGTSDGLNGTLNVSYARNLYHRSNVGMNVTYKKKKFLINTGYQFNEKIGYGIIDNERTYIDPGNEFKSLNSNSDFHYLNQSHNPFFNVQYKLNDIHTVNLDLSNSRSNSNGKGEGNTILTTRDDLIRSITTSQSDGSYKWMSNNISLTYKAKPDTNGTLFLINANYNGNRSKVIEGVYSHYFDSVHHDIGNPYQFISNNSRTYDLYSAKIDFTKSVKTIKFETGVKVNFVNNFNKMDAAITEDSIAGEINNHFLYKENVYSGYLILNRKFEKWKVQLGLRLEHTDVKGIQPLIDSTFTRNYTNLFPSGNISYNPSEKTSYTFLYSRRIQRPEADKLNPTLQIINPYNSYGGNPYLLAQYSDNLEFAYSILGGVLITTLSYSHNTNHISYVIRTDESGIHSKESFLNMKKRDQAGLSITMNKSITNWWTTSNYAYGFYTDFVGGPGYENYNFSRFSWSATSTQTFKLPKKYKLELYGKYEAPKAQNAFGMNLALWQVNLSMQKELLDGKLSLKISASDIFWSNRWAVKTTTETATIKLIEKWDSQMFMFSLTYKFGKKEGKETK